MEQAPWQRRVSLLQARSGAHSKVFAGLKVGALMWSTEKMVGWVGWLLQTRLVTARLWSKFQCCHADHASFFQKPSAKRRGSFRASSWRHFCCWTSEIRIVELFSPDMSRLSIAENCRVVPPLLSIQRVLTRKATFSSYGGKVSASSSHHTEPASLAGLSAWYTMDIMQGKLISLK